jgi:type IV secretion system protein VirD4
MLWVVIVAVVVPVLTWLLLRRAGAKAKRRMKLAAIVTVVLLAIAGVVWLANDPVAGDNFREHPLGFTVGLLIFLGYIYLTWKHGGREPEPPPPELPPLSTTYGSARYADQVTTLPEGGEQLFSGVFFGKSSRPESHGGDVSAGLGAPICSRPENHTLIVAKTRTGKGTRVIIPTLLRATKTSALVIDPKGENAVITARPRSLTNHVHIMNPWGELGDTYRNLGFPPATLNPLDILDRNDPNVVSIAQSMGTTMSPSEGQKEPFWAASAANIIAAVLLWLTDREGLPQFADGPPEEKTLGRLADILSRSRKSFTEEYVSKMAASGAFGGAIRKLSSPFLGMPDVTYGGIMGHIAQATAFLTDPQIVAATASSSFSMTDLTGAGKDRPTTLYLVVPWDKVDIQKTWLRLMITAGMHTFRRKPPGSHYRCLFLIDEFPALGRIDDMPREIAGMSGAGVDFALVVQGLAKLKDVYGDAHADIIGNCAYKWFCNVNDLQSAEFLSKTLGNKTVRTTNRGENKGSSFSSGPNAHSSTSEGDNISYGETGRALLMPEEVLNLGSETAILLAPNSRPHYLRPVDYWKLQEAFSMFRASYPQLYWPLYYDRNACLASDRPQCTPQPPLAAGQMEPGQMDIGTQTTTGASHIDLTAYAPKNAPRPTRTAPAREQSKPSGSPNYDPDYYSPQRIAERAAAAKKPAGDG